MKKGRIILSIVLAIVGIFSALTFAGCDVNVETVSKTIEEVNQQYTTYADIFSSGDIIHGTYETKYIVDYGTVVNNYVKSTDERYREFNELESKYNMLLALSQKYIDSNSALVLNYEKYNKFNGEARKYLNEFNDRLKDFSKTFEKFAKERKNMMDYFNKYKNSTSEREEQSHLLLFKRAYGPFVSSCVNAAAALAKCIENTEIFDILKATEINKNNIIILKDFVEIKTAEVFNTFFIDGILNKITWSVYESKESAVVDVFNETEDFYNDVFVNGFVCHEDNFKTEVTKEKYQELFNLTDAYLLEAESFMNATNDFDFNKWAITYECNEKKYAENENKLALLDLQKMKQFVNLTAVQFYNNFKSAIYN